MEKQLEKDLQRVEKALNISISQLLKEHHRLRQLMSKKEETLTKLHEVLHLCQRTRINAANAEAKLAPVIVKRLQEESGLSPMQVKKALFLIRAGLEAERKLGPATATATTTMEQA